MSSTEDDVMEQDTTVSFRPLERADLPLLARWQSNPHVAEWWRAPADLASITRKYSPRLDGLDPTEVFVIEAGGQPVGVIQRYLLADNPDWAATIRVADGAGIDYYIGEQSFTGRGIGSRVIGDFAEDTFARYPSAPTIAAAPQQDNVASWRALEKAGFERLWAGQLNSDDPSDAGPAYVYVLARLSRRRRAHGRAVTPGGAR
jgi:aminoglycoside 6'-N-acetyltransferase